MLPIRPDNRKKPEKYFRIEGTLEPLNRLGKLIFNKNEENNPHMDRCKTQFISFNRKAKLMDAPDAVEGGVKILQDMEAVQATGSVEFFERPVNNKRF